LRFKLEQAFGNRILAGEKVTDKDIRDLLFGNYMEPDADPKIYDEVENWPKLEKNMMYYLNEYNMLSNSPMDLVLFRFAIEHISRVSRVLEMPRGHVMLVGKFILFVNQFLNNFSNYKFSLNFESLNYFLKIRPWRFWTSFCC
jgi:dynein heavy chain